MNRTLSTFSLTFFIHLFCFAFSRVWDMIMIFSDIFNNVTLHCGLSWAQSIGTSPKFYTILSYSNSQISSISSNIYIFHLVSLCVIIKLHSIINWVNSAKTAKLLFLYVELFDLINIVCTITCFWITKTIKDHKAVMLKWNL